MFRRSFVKLAAAMSAMLAGCKQIEQAAFNSTVFEELSFGNEGLQVRIVSKPDIGGMELDGFELTGPSERRYNWSYDESRSYIITSTDLGTKFVPGSYTIVARASQKGSVGTHSVDFDLAESDNEFEVTINGFSVEEEH